MYDNVSAPFVIFVLYIFDSESWPSEPALSQLSQQFKPPFYLYFLEMNSSIIIIYLGTPVITVIGNNVPQGPQSFALVATYSPLYAIPIPAEGDNCYWDGASALGHFLQYKVGFLLLGLLGFFL